MYAAISSASLSLLATGIDSVFDIGSNILLICMHKKGERLDESKWPVGGSRLQTIGNIVYGMVHPILKHNMMKQLYYRLFVCALKKHKLKLLFIIVLEWVP